MESKSIARKVMAVKAAFTLEDLDNGRTPPKCLMDEVYQLMLEESVDPDYMCDREADYVMRVLEKGPWGVKL